MRGAPLYLLRWCNRFLFYVASNLLNCLIKAILVLYTLCCLIDWSQFALSFTFRMFDVPFYYHYLNTTRCFLTYEKLELLCWPIIAIIVEAHEWRKLLLPQKRFRLSVKSLTLPNATGQVPDVFKAKVSTLLSSSSLPSQ